MSEGTLEKLAQVAVEGAEHDSRERLPHPQCLKGTRVDLLDYIYGVLDDKSNNRLIWLHGTAGVGKSAVAFTVAERMRSLKVTEETNVEKRLAGTFFFSRKHTNRRTTGRLFATLAYQLASNFPSIRTYVNKTILENPALLHPNGSLRKQMEVLLSRPLRQLKSRLRDCPPLAFVIDALDECTESLNQSAPESLDQPTIEPFDENKSEIELAELISLLAQALRDPDLPATHILVTSRSEAHIHEAMQHEDVHPLVCEIPVKISGQGIAAIISLDGADVDKDIYLFLEHSFMKLQSRIPTFPQPTKVQLERLANRAGRRFIVASTMMKFIDDRHNDPYDRLELMLELASDLLPGTEVYRLYDRILSTCADPTQAYLHLSVVAALSDPLPMSQISKLLGPGEGRDVERVLVQLRSVIDVPTDNSLPVNIYHSSVRDYVSHRSNCSLPQVKYTTPPHSLLALSSLRLMVREIPESTALLDALSELNKHNQAMESHDPQNLNESLSFMVQPPEPLQVLIGLLWLRGHRSSELRFWLETLDGRAWLQTAGAKDWLLTQEGQDWLLTDGGLLTQWGKAWLQSQGVRVWLQTEGAQGWLQTEDGRVWLQTERAEGWLQTEDGRVWLQTEGGEGWLQTEDGRVWLRTEGGRSWLQTEGGRVWLQTEGGRSWLQIGSGQHWFGTEGGRDWLLTDGGTQWLLTDGGTQWLLMWARGWLRSRGGNMWLQTNGGQSWLLTMSGRAWLRTVGRPVWLQIWGGKGWLQTERGRVWLQTENGQDWLNSEDGQDWLNSEDGQCWLKYEGGQDWLESKDGRDWLKSEDGQYWLKSEDGQYWLKYRDGQDWLLQSTWGQRLWLQTESGQNWLNFKDGQNWLKSEDGQNWLKSEDGQDWLKSEDGEDWLKFEDGQDWLDSEDGQDWLKSEDGQDWLLQSAGGRRLWLKTEGGQHWLQTQRGKVWLQSEDGQDWLQFEDGQDWLQTMGGRVWLQSEDGQDWLQTMGGRVWLLSKDGLDWLESEDGQDWLQTKRGQVWLKTVEGRVWVQIRGGTGWLQTERGRVWLQSEDGQDWLQFEGGGGHDWLQTEGGRVWLQSKDGQDWVESEDGQDWVETKDGQAWVASEDRQDWLQTMGGRVWLESEDGQDWLQTMGGQAWLESEEGQDLLQDYDQQHSPTPPQPSLFPHPSSADLVQTWDDSWLQIHGVRNLQTPDQQDWLQTQAGRHWLQTQAGYHWLQTQAGRGWLQSHAARKCLQTLGGQNWPQTRSRGSWLLTLHGRRWLQTQSGEDWLQTQGGQDWLRTRCGQDWLLILGGEDWLQAEGGRDWLQVEGGRKWLQADGGQKWLQTEGGRDWLQNQGGRDWLLTPYGQAWRLSTIWVTTEEFSSTLEALGEYIIAPDMHSHPAFQVIQQFKNLPDFLMFPAFLALRHQDHSPTASPHGCLPLDIEIIHAMNAFSSFAYEAREESQSASDVLKYACQNWVVHLSRAPNPSDEKLSHIFQSFWDRNLLSWLARQWCLKDLRSCLTILSEGEKIAKQHLLQTSGSSQ